MTDLTADKTRTIVREHYAKVSTKSASAATGCCGAMPAGQSLGLGYSSTDLTSVPEGADLGLGCGNPNAIAALKPGETVLDLGSGGGFDSFLAARAVGPTGRVIGVDMTPEMISRARENARKVDATNVEFRLGEIEHLPIADQTVDAIMSNAEMVGISVSGMKSRVQRGRAQLREMLERCCEIAVDVRGKPIAFTPRPQPSCKTSCS